MAYRMKAIPMTPSHLQGLSYCKPFKCDCLYSCAAVDKMSTDKVHCAALCNSGSSCILV